MYTIFRHTLARNSLRHIIQYYKITEMHIPYYLCDSVRHTLVEENCKPIFYHVNDEFFPEINFSAESYILYPNYFGICSKNVKKLDSQYPRLIVDNAHAFFDEPIGFAGFNSAYKFKLGDFSYLWMGAEEKSNIVIPDFKQEKRERKAKFLNLHKKFSSTNLLKIDTEAFPFCYPYLAKDDENADILAKELSEKGLTIYRYWNPMPKSYNEYKFYSRLVPIPIEN